MAWATMSFKSKTLNMPVEAEILLPQPGYKSLVQTDDYKVIVLLHGVRNDRTEWLLKSQIYDMVKELPVIVFMPSGKNSFYVNTHNGYKYMDFISEEIPGIIRDNFRASEDKKNWLVAGESMGGYGSLAVGLTHTETFGNIASFSGAVDIKKAMKDLEDIEAEQILGDEVDLFSLCSRIPEYERPRVFMCCGEEDSLFDANERFYKLIKDHYDVTCMWGKGGHDFVYWNERLKDMFKWFCPDDLKNGYFMGRCGNEFC